MQETSQSATNITVTSPISRLGTFISPKITTGTLLYSNSAGGLLSVRLRAAESPEWGRFISAVDEIAVGEDIIANYKPYAQCLFKNELTSHCHHCFQPLANKFFLGCSKCSYARYPLETYLGGGGTKRPNFECRYCSVDCKEEQMDIHKIECGRYLFDAFPVESLIAIRTLLRHHVEETSYETKIQILTSLLNVWCLVERIQRIIN